MPKAAKEFNKKIKIGYNGVKGLFLYIRSCSDHGEIYEI